jgi:hypothetical protein
MNSAHIISTDEDPGLRIESFAVINLRGASTNKTIIDSNIFDQNFKLYFVTLISAYTGCPKKNLRCLI